jgi:hypothetical protein
MPRPGPLLRGSFRRNRVGQNLFIRPLAIYEVLEKTKWMPTASNYQNWPGVWIYGWRTTQRQKLTHGHWLLGSFCYGNDMWIEIAGQQEEILIR